MTWVARCPETAVNGHNCGYLGWASTLRSRRLPSSSEHRRQWGCESRLPEAGAVGLSPGVDRALHCNEIPIDIELVRTMVDRVMPDYADAPVRRLASSGSTNALFRLGDELLVRLPRQPGGSAAISKEAAWLPVV